MAKIKLRAFPTFVLRTPLFPLSALDNPERTMQQPCFREALYLASPDLYTFTGDKTEDAEEKGDAAALKYFLRAWARAVRPSVSLPGCSTGASAPRRDRRCGSLSPHGVLHGSTCSTSAR